MIFQESSPPVRVITTGSFLSIMKITVANVLMISDVRLINHSTPPPSTGVAAPRHISKITAFTYSRIFIQGVQKNAWERPCTVAQLSRRCLTCPLVRIHSRVNEFSVIANFFASLGGASVCGVTGEKRQIFASQSRK